MNELPTAPDHPVPASTVSEKESSFLLTAIDVFNWGPFHGRHHCGIDPRGTAIIGPTGSGKTTLVDALMTLLAPYPKYNLASTGGHESDRDLISYVRGASGVESAEAENSHVARPSKTLTGLAASYSDGNQLVTIGCLLWVDGASNAADDLKKSWFFAQNIPALLDTLLTLHHEGGKAALTRHARETAGLRHFPSKKEYLAQVRGFFEVSENAFSLLNRAAGLKQINSIDQIFRELVLDDRSAFDRASEVAQEFDTLHGIYEELETARRQRDSLLPVREGKISLEKAQEKLSTCRRLKDQISVWFAEAAVRLWKVEEENLNKVKNETQTQLQAAEFESASCDERVRIRNEEYLKHGGADIQNIEALIIDKEKREAEVQKYCTQYQLSAGKIGLTEEVDKAIFEENLRQLPKIREQADSAKTKAREQAIELAGKLAQCREKEQKLSIEIQEVEARPHSNIPAAFQAFRELLAAELNLRGEELPFLAEMIEVKISERRWQGAIERAIGSERLRILVPASRTREALKWINSRDNRLHVRLLSANSSPGEASFLTDGYARKLDYRDHSLRDQVKLLISRRDRHCVSSTEELHRTEYAMTVEGSMSERDGRFDKQDQRSLSADWMTGFDNRHLLSSLQEQRQLENSNIARLKGESDAHARMEGEWSQKIQLIDQLEMLEFSQIDTESIKAEIARERQRLNDLTKPDSDAAAAKARHDEALKDSKSAKDEVKRLTRKLGSDESAHKAAVEAMTDAEKRRGPGISEEDSLLMEREFPVAELTASRIVDEERAANGRIDHDIRTAEGQNSKAEGALIRAMEGAKRVDTGPLGETGTELRDLEAYLRRLETLEQESLPEKLQRFLEYLNQSSGQGVTQLLSSINNDVSLIQERVTDLNTTLSRVDFRQGQFLQLHAQTVGHAALQQMETAQRKLRHIVLSQREDEGEAHYRALGEVVRLLREAAEKRHTLGAQALLDPRHRLQFSVVEVERSTGRNSGARKGSQTGSGGEKEMMASYILTASLSYALCPDGATIPRYASIVLDEAFSKSSPAAAARIIEALRAFGLHPLFVTPNKEISLLKAHTHSAVLVHNKNKRATLTSVTWEEIANSARSRKLAEEVEPPPA